MLNLQTAAEPWLIPSDYISNITWYEITLHPQISKPHTCSQLKQKNTLAARFVMSRAIACHRHTVKPNHAWDQSWDIDLKLNWLAPWYCIGGCACGGFCCCWWFFHFGCCCWFLLVVAGCCLWLGIGRCFLHEFMMTPVSKEAYLGCLQWVFFINHLYWLW